MSCPRPPTSQAKPLPRVEPLGRVITIDLRKLDRPFFDGKGNLIDKIKLQPESPNYDEWIYKRGEVFVEPNGMWLIEKIKGKCLVGIKLEVDGKTYFWWPKGEDFHKLVLGLVHATRENDYNAPKILKLPRRQTRDDDLRAIRALLRNSLKYLERNYGTPFLRDFLGVELNGAE